MLRALTEPQPFSWEGRHYHYRTGVRLAQAGAAAHAAGHRSHPQRRHHQIRRRQPVGPGHCLRSLDATAAIVNKYRSWCAASRVVALVRLHRLPGRHLPGGDRRQGRGLPERPPVSRRGAGLSISSSLARAVGAARSGHRYDSRADAELPNSTPRPPRALLNFVGGPDTVAGQIEDLHHRCGVGVVDLAFQQPACPIRE